MHDRDSMSRGADPFEPVLAALAADPSTEFGAPGAQIEMLRRVEGPYSSLRRVRIRTPARTVQAYIKILKPRGPGEEELAQAERSLQREYRVTAALYKTLKQDAGIGAVRPIALLREHRTLVTEEVPGRPLSELLVEASSPTDELLAIASRVGAWARAYQSLDEASRTIQLADLRAYLDCRLALLEGRVLSASDRQATLARFDALSEEIGSPVVPAVSIHADLTPANIIVDENGRVTVLDFTMAKTGTFCHDLSHVYLHLALMAARHRGRTELFRALQRAMLRGYAPSLSADDPLFRMMLLQHGVCHVALLAERRVPLIDAAYRWFVRRRWQVCERLPARAGEVTVTN